MNTIHPLLVNLVRGYDDTTALSLSAGENDWSAIARDATRHGLMYFLYDLFSKPDMHGRVPPQLLREAKRECFRLAASNIMLLNELRVILRTFEERHVQCAPLRGLALAELLYGDVTARPMGDLDLLVRKEELPLVARMLMGLGFQEVDRRPGFARAFSYTLEFFKDRNGSVLVEPHWTIAYPPFADSVDMEMVWRRCVQGKVVGVDTWLLSRADLLVHLCFHLIHRGDSAPLLWFYELDRLLRQEKTALDWRQVVLIARQTGLELFLAEVLGKVKGLFDSPIPEHVLSQLRAQPMPHPAWAVGRSVESRVVRMMAGGSRVDGLESFALLFTIEGLRAKVRYALALLFPSPEFMLLHYGLSSRKQLGLCYLGRVVHLCWEALKRIGGLLVTSRTPRQSPP